VAGHKNGTKGSGNFVRFWYIILRSDLREFSATTSIPTAIRFVSRRRDQFLGMKSLTWLSALPWRTATAPQQVRADCENSLDLTLSSGQLTAPADCSPTRLELLTAFVTSTFGKSAFGSE
jgi:hypothetical protein